MSSSNLSLKPRRRCSQTLNTPPIRRTGNSSITRKATPFPFAKPVTLPSDGEHHVKIVVDSSRTRGGSHIERQLTPWATISTSPKLEPKTESLTTSSLPASTTTATTTTGTSDASSTEPEQKRGSRKSDGGSRLTVKKKTSVTKKPSSPMLHSLYTQY